MWNATSNECPRKRMKREGIPLDEQKAQAEYAVQRPGSGVYL